MVKVNFCYLQSAEIDEQTLNITHYTGTKLMQSKNCMDDIRKFRNKKGRTTTMCILSFLLFNLHSEVVFREALDNIKPGITINGSRINNVDYADDTVVLSLYEYILD